MWVNGFAIFGQGLNFAHLVNCKYVYLCGWDRLVIPKPNKCNVWTIKTNVILNSVNKVTANNSNLSMDNCFNEGIRDFEQIRLSELPSCILLKYNQQLDMY